MIIIPAIDLKNGTCVRVMQGEQETAVKVANDPVETALNFEKAGATQLQIVDLDGAVTGKLKNQDIVFEIARKTSLQIQAGGGIRSMEDAEKFLENGVAKIVVGQVALHNKALLEELVKKYENRIIASIAARDGMVAADGWLSISEVDYMTLAAEMEKIGVRNLIFTDMSRNGTMDGPNLDALDKLNFTYSMNIMASGGISSLKDIIDLSNLNLHAAICGKALYSGTMDIKSALTIARLLEESANNRKKMPTLERFFQKSGLIPVVIQEEGTNQVLMLGHMNREALKMTLETGRTWFYSRSHHEIWNMGANSDGNYQDVISVYADHDNDSLLMIVRQHGDACRTGEHSCYHKKVYER